MARIYLSSSDKIIECENNLVTLTMSDGTIYDRLEPRRLFPVSREDEYITLLDEGGVEIAVIRRLRDVDDNSVKILKKSLDDYYLVPHITRIISTAEKYGTLRWTVETDRGIKVFDIRNRNHDIRVSKSGTVRVRDADDNRYTIDNYHELDPHSRALLVMDI
ncbi:MAG: DUF1854 domain-containing protein [Clostridia bacterium]|nr:DUF1854 domain-containing protein [Clostridia bacterium]